MGPLEIGTDVVIEVLGIEERQEGPAGHTPTSVVRLRWSSARAASLFPAMEAELAIYPLSRDETQIELRGRYRPPFGPVGGALDSLVGHRVAEASVHRFVTDVATQLRAEVTTARSIGRSR